MNSLFRTAGRGISLFLLIFFSLGPDISAQEGKERKFRDFEKTFGPDNCIHCHQDEVDAYQRSRHYFSKDLRDYEKTAEIAEKMEVRGGAAGVHRSALCAQCHFTVGRSAGEPPRFLSGVSCESCHGGAKDWLSKHTTGDRREGDEFDTIEKREKRVAESKANGLVYKEQVHIFADRCMSCHIVTHEKLVNHGGHPPLDTDFELASWLQGEVRHNLFYSKGKVNAETPITRRRLHYVIGKAVEMEYSLRGLARATEKGEYGNAMGRNCLETRKEIGAIIEALGEDVPAELVEIEEAIRTPAIKYFNVGPLIEAADKVKGLAADLVEKHDGSKFGAIDRLIPAEAKGRVYTP